MLELSDGTKVWLNSDSELRFPITFVGDRRSVEIEGEAYFEVAKDEGKPFHVLANGVDIKVLGTSFNVMAYRGHTITTLVEGKVVMERRGVLFRKCGFRDDCRAFVAMV